MGVGFKFVILFILLSSTSSFAKPPGLTCEGLFDLRTEVSKDLPLKQNSRFKVVTWNLALFKIVRPELLVDSEEIQKQASLLAEVRRVTDELNADVYVFQEVSNEESLNVYNERYMGNRYRIFVMEGNDRTSRIAIAIKKSLNVDIGIKTYKDLKWNGYRGPMPVFLRDFPVIFLTQKDGSGKKDRSRQPDAIIMATHRKSKRHVTSNPRDSRSNIIDFESKQWRSVEDQAAAKIFNDWNNRYNGRVPIIVAGDFNGDIATSPELNKLNSITNESLALMGNALSADDHVTFTSHILLKEKNYEGDLEVVDETTKATQIDAQLLNDAMVPRLVSSSVYHYKNSNGQEKLYSRGGVTKKYPLLYSQRDQARFDHMPVVGIYNMTDDMTQDP